jgi:hypothetical protein
MIQTFALALSICFADPSFADGSIADALKREILGKRQSLDEAREFVEPRIPKTPEVKTAAEWDTLKGRYRAEVASKVIFRGEAAAWRDAKTGVVWGPVIDGSGYKIKKLRIEVLPGLWVPALLYEPENLSGRVPVVLNVNGHDAKGKAAEYKQIRCINQAKRGILALNLEWFGMGQLKSDGFTHGQINTIDLCGTSGIATHFLAMKRGIDVLLSHEHADQARVGVTGLSGGGWQTIFVSPLDSRVTLTDPVAGYSSFLTRTRYDSDLGDSEQTPCDLATVVDYTHLTAMMAPHPTLLTFNAKDNCCFAAPHALAPLLEAAAPIFRLYDKEDNLRSHVNQDPGDHNYGLDNRQAFYRHIGQAWFKNDAKFDPKEIACDDEVKTAKELEVELPEDNLSLNKIALLLGRDLPHERELPAERSAAQAWQESRRKALRSVVKPIGGEVRPLKLESDENDGLSTTFWKLRVGDVFTVPAVELSRGQSPNTVLLVSDSGRASVAEAAKNWLDRGFRVIALDPFYFGEAKVADHAYLWALMIATVGERALGVQAGELMAIARWAKAEHPGEIAIAAMGPRTSTIALIAAALEPTTVARVEVTDPLASLKLPIEEKREYAATPELFCFGLLEQCNIGQIAALVAPRPLAVHKASPRATDELRELKSWYQRLGSDVDPLSN